MEEQGRLYLFGHLRAEVDGEGIHIGRRKGNALLSYLVITGKAQARDTLLTLLWPDFDRASAQNNLRRELALLRSALGSDFLQSNRSDIWLSEEFKFWSDFERFNQLINLPHLSDDVLSPAHYQALEEANALASHPLLTDLSLPDAPEFNDWLFFERADVQQKRLGALAALINHATVSGEFATAIGFAKQQLAIDPLTEHNHRLLMRLYAYDDQPAAAEHQYAQCVTRLQSELGIDPEGETVALIEAIRTRRLQPIMAVESMAVVSTSTRAPASLALPDQSGPFVGRQSEMTAIQHLLVGEKECRLLNILGAGGIGKTSIVVQMAPSLIEHFPDGIFFIPLAAEAATDGVPYRIIEGIGIQQRQGDPIEQLVEYLGQTQTLLILDNFEHLLAASSYLDQLLQGCDQLKILVTSREPLGLAQEWLYPMGGLPVPDIASNQEDLAGNAAVQLFVRSARHASPLFELSAENHRDIGEICRISNGIPLAIKLAAAWVHIMTCCEIADEIKNDYEILATSQRNISERHRSMHAVFAYSWDRLPQKEQAIYAQLSIFRGGFSRDSAKKVTGASVVVLRNLLNRSLLRLERNGRYQIHELLRQFAKSKLEEMGAPADAVFAAHQNHYLTLLDEVDPLMNGGDQVEALNTILADLDNIEAAWQHAIDHGTFHQLVTGTGLLSHFFHYTGRYVEAIEFYERTRVAVEEKGEGNETLLTRLLVSAAWFEIHCGNLRKASTLISKAETLDAPINWKDPAYADFDPLLPKSILLFWAGEYEQSQASSEQALINGKGSPYDWRDSVGHYSLSRTLRFRGDLPGAIHHAQEMLRITQLTNDAWLTAYAYIELGTIALEQGEYSAAHGYFSKSLAARKVFNDPEGIGRATNYLAKTELLRGNFDAAIAQFLSALDIYKNLKHPSGMLTAYDGLAQAMLGKADFGAACDNLVEALAVSKESPLVWPTLSLLTEAGQLLGKNNRLEQAASPLTLAATHPGTQPSIRRRAEHWLTEFGVSSEVEPDPDDLVSVALMTQSNLRALSSQL